MYSTIQGNLCVLAFVLELQMLTNLFLGASTNLGFQNKQQRLKSLNLSGTDMSKVMTLAPSPFHEYQDHPWLDVPAGSQVACRGNCEAERDNSHLHMSHFVGVSIITTSET